MSTRYELRIGGHLGEHWSAWFGEVSLSRNEDGTTTMRVTVTDQAALHGLLAKVRDLGLTLISLRPLHHYHEGGDMLSIAQIVIDCADAAKLAGFWSRVLGRPVDPGANQHFATIGADPKLMFLQVPEAKQGKNRLHIDLHGQDWQDEVERVVGLGATKLSEHKEYGTEWATLTDPEGNEFDIAAG